MSSPPSWLLIHLTLLFPIHLGHARGGADWNAPNIVIQGGEWVQISPEVYDGTSPDYPQPPPPYDDRWQKNDTKIIVLIAAFRETKCKDSLVNLFSKAAFPERVHIGLVQQNHPTEDEDCVYAYCRMRAADSAVAVAVSEDAQWDASNCPFFAQIKAKRLTAAEAKGPVYARALQAELVEEEDFCMQMDAHSDAAEHWDVHMLREWGACRNEFAVISTYPSNIKDIGRNSNKHWEMPHLCEASILGMGQVTQQPNFKIVTFRCSFSISMFSLQLLIIRESSRNQMNPCLGS